jgi:ribonuclease HI
VQCPPTFSRFDTIVSGSRKDSIELEKKDEADFKVFSDGSGYNDGIGAAAVLYRKGRYTPMDNLKFYIGSMSKHNTYEAETIGAILATWLLKTRPETIGKRVSLYIDNQSVISSISNPKATSGQHLVRHLIALANGLACNLGIRWISSHSKVRGNEKVDELAKDAADGRSSARINLPHLLRNPILTSASATKQAYHRTLKAKWEILWGKSDRSRRFAAFDEDFPFNSFRKRTYQLTRSQASLMIQIRSGHIPLNGYLFKINKSNTEFCQACEEDETNMQCRETVKHFLFECPSYSQEREDFVEKITRSHLNLKDIMLNTDHMRALAAFVNRTGRLKKP